GPWGGRVGGRRGLAGEEEARPPAQGLAYPEPLLHPLRDVLDPPVPGLREAHALEELGALGGAPVGVGEPLVQPQELVGGAPSWEAEELGQVADGPPGGPRTGRRATHLRPPGGGPHQAADDLHERRLARPVGAAEPDELA